MTKYYTKEEVEEILSNPSWHCTLYDLEKLCDKGSSKFREPNSTIYYKISDCHIKQFREIINEIKDGK